MTRYLKEKINHYSVYGLNISTEFVLEELVPLNGKTNLFITKAVVPNFLMGTTKSCAFFQAKDNEFLTRIKHVGSFYAFEGKEIIYEPYHDADYMLMKMYLYGLLLPVILMQRGRFPIHGSCIDLGGKSIIISGHSGAGKSSLGIALRLAGYRMIADDLVVISDVCDEEIYPQYGFPIQKITVDTAKYLNIDTVGLTKIPDEDKYMIPLEAEFQKEPVPLRALFEIATHDGDEVIIQELIGGEKLRCIIANTYNVEMIGAMGLAQEHFIYGTSLTKMIKVFRITRPIHGFSLDQQMKLIMVKMSKLYS